MIYELPVGTPNNIAGSDIVWEHGGKVMVVGIEDGPDGEKWSTTGLEEELIRRGREIFGGENNG